MLDAKEFAKLDNKERKRIIKRGKEAISHWEQAIRVRSKYSNKIQMAAVFVLGYLTAYLIIRLIILAPADVLLKEFVTPGTWLLSIIPAFLAIIYEFWCIQRGNWKHNKIFTKTDKEFLGMTSSHRLKSGVSKDKRR